MKKNLKLIFLYMLFSFFTLSTISFSDQSGDISSELENFSLFFKPEKKKEYIQTRKDYYMDLLKLKNQKENTAESGEKLSKYLQANYSNIDWNSDYTKTLDIAALCYAAAEIQCPTPIALYADQFEFSLFAYEKYFGKSRVEDRLEDYPFMFLAVRCGLKSIPALQSIILDPEKRPELRLKATATLMKVDPEAAISSALRIQDELNPEMRSILTSYLENPQTEPWDVLVRFSSRSRAIMERKTQK